MKNKTTTTLDTNVNGLINPENLWAIENELIDIPLQYRDDFWREVLSSYTPDLSCEK